MRSGHLVFFCRDAATTGIYPLSLHDALPISVRLMFERLSFRDEIPFANGQAVAEIHARSRRQLARQRTRSEEHTSELQSRLHLVCRLLLEKKKPISWPRMILFANS